MSRIKNKNMLQNEQIETEEGQTVTEATFNTMVVPEEQAQESAKIYLGPNLPGGRLLQSTVFRAGIPSYLLPLLTEQPDVSELIVPVEEMAEVQARIVQAGTAEFVVYQRLLGKGI